MVTENFYFAAVWFPEIMVKNIERVITIHCRKSPTRLEVKGI